MEVKDYELMHEMYGVIYRQSRNLDIILLILIVVVVGLCTICGIRAGMENRIGSVIFESILIGVNVFNGITTIIRMIRRYRGMLVEQRLYELIVEEENASIQG